MNVIRKLSLLGAFASLGLLHAAISRADDILIGLNTPLTGAFAASGNFIAQGAEIAVDEINAKGGVLGRKLKLVTEDNKSNPTESAAVTEKLITQSKVPVMMGAWGSTLTLAAMPKLQQYEIPMLVETSGADKITLSANPYVFRISAPAALEAAAFEKHLGSLSIKKADFLLVNNDWGRSTGVEFSKTLKAHKIETGLTQYMDQTATDVSAQISKIKFSDSDTVIVTAAVDQLTMVLKQMQSVGIKKQIITTGGSQNPDQLIDHAGSASEGTIHLVFFAPWEPEKSADPEMSASFISAWEARMRPVAGLTESFRGYDGIKVIAAAIEKAGSAEPAAIKEALWSVSVKTLNGPVSFAKVGPSGRESGQSNPNIYFAKVVNGKIEVLE